MAKYRNKHGIRLEIPSLRDEPYTNWMTDDNFSRLALRVKKQWLPFIVNEFQGTHKPQNAPQVIREFWDSNEKAKNDDNYKIYKRIVDSAVDEALTKEDIYSVPENTLQGIKKHFNNRYPGSQMRLMNSVANLFFPMKMASFDSNCGTYCEPNRRENGFKAREKIINTVHILEKYYSYNPELERQQKEAVALRKMENAKYQQLENQIQQLKLLKTEGVSNLEKSANELAKHIQQSRQAQENTSRAFSQFQQTVNENLKQRGEDYDRNLNNFKTSAENELSNIKQNHAVLMEKLRSRMKRRMLSDAPEMKASYNFFADIFAGNK